MKRLAFLFAVLPALPVSLARADAPAPSTPGPAPQVMTLDDAIHLAFERNRDVIAAKIGISAAEVEKMAAQVLPNPVFNYTLANLPVGNPTIICANDIHGMTIDCKQESFFGGSIHSFGLSWELDVWGKRHLRTEAAEAGIEVARAQLKDALRAVANAVTNAYVNLQHAEDALTLTNEVSRQYGETVRASRDRFTHGDAAGTDFQKIELEMIKYEAAQLAAQQERALDERVLKELLALSPEMVDIQVFHGAPTTASPPPLKSLVDEAMRDRPDLQAALVAEEQAQRQLAFAHRVAVPNPDAQLGYTHSTHTYAGDNPNTFSAGVSIALPFFDRNQGDVGRARIAIRNAENAIEKMKLTVAHDVAEASIRTESTRRILESYEKRSTDVYGKETNRLERATQLLTAATAAYKIGATSILDLLEAQRTYNQTRSDYIEALAAYRQALAMLANSLGKNGVYGEGAAR